MSIFIPNKINVGYQNREGTYTGKLAYVIYYDERGNWEKKHLGKIGGMKIYQIIYTKTSQQMDSSSIKKLEGIKAVH